MMNEPLQAKVCDAIEEAMAVAGVSRAELSRRIKVTRGAVTKALGGDNDFKISTLGKIAEALDAEWHVELKAQP